MIEKEAPGLTIAMIKNSLDVTPKAMLSRLVKRSCLISSKLHLVMVFPSLVIVYKQERFSKLRYPAYKQESKMSSYQYVALILL